MLKNLRAYGNSLWSDLVARMTGLASASFTGWQVYSDFFSGDKGVAHARWYWWLAAALCFVIATYRVWLDEHKKVLSQNPRFVITVEHADWEYSPENNETTIVLAVSLVNIGAPSAARFWGGSITVGSITEDLIPINMTGKWILADPAGKNPLLLLPQDQITWKTVNGSLSTGESRTGRLFLSTPGDRLALLVSLNWSIEVKCCDSFGNKFTGMMTPSPGAMTIRKAFPGEQHLSKEAIEELKKVNAKQLPRRTRSAKTIRGRNEETLSDSKT